MENTQKRTFVDNLSARKLLIYLLDYEHGVNDDAFVLLCDFAAETNNEDVVQRASEGKNKTGNVFHYLEEPDAEEFRSSLPSE
jgi:hypothetical protein